MRIFLGRLATVLIIAWCLFAFVILTVVPVQNWIETSGWESHEAILEQAEIVKTGPHSRDRRLSVKYRYSWNTETHEGYVTTPYHSSQSMPISLQHALLKQFKAEADQKTLRAFVNPDEPTDSVLTRDFYPDWYTRNIFYLVLTLYFSFGAFWVIQLLKETGTDIQIPTQEKYESPFWKFSAYFAGLFSLLSMAIIKMIITSMREGNYSVLAFLIFPAASILLWWLTRYAWVKRFDINQHTSPPTLSTKDLKQHSE